MTKGENLVILTPAAHAEKMLNLQACVDEWHTQYGMITALLRVQTCVGLYIERSQFLPQGAAATPTLRQSE